MLFDFHAETERLAVLGREADGRHKIFLRTVQGQALGEIAAEFLPQEPHWSLYFLVPPAADAGFWSAFHRIRR